MYFLLIVLAAACAIGLTVAIMVRRHRRYQPIRKWMEDYEWVARYRTETLFSLHFPPSGPWDDNPKVVAARKKLQTVKVEHEQREHEAEQARAEHCREIAARFDQLKKRVEGYRTSGVTDTDYKDLLNIVYDVHGEDRKWVMGKIKELSDQRAEGLLEAARAGDREAYMELRGFVWPHYSPYRSVTRVDYTFPPDWDDLVASYIANPQFDEFRSSRTDLAPGECRLLAAKALRTRSLRDGKIVLALCNKRDEYGRRGNLSWRQEIGDVLLAEVTKLVERLNMEVGLSARGAIQ